MFEQNPILDALQTSVIVNRKDRPGQTFWTEWRTGLVLQGGTAAQAGDLAILGPDGKFDPSVIPGSGGSTVSVNGTAVSDPNFNDASPAAPIGYTNVKWQFDGSGNVSAYYATSGTTLPFDEILTGTNTSAQMTVAGTAVLEYSGTGVVNANEIGGIDVAVNAPSHEGQVLISQPGNASAAWADPQVQGLYPDGSSITSPPPYTPPTTIQPIYVGGQGTDGLLHGLLTTSSGALVVLSETQTINAAHFAWDTGVDPVLLISGVLQPLISFRPKSSATSITFYFTGFDLFMAPAIGEWQLLKNATLTGASFTDVAGSNGQQDTAATSVNGGIRVDSGYSINGTRTNAYSLTAKIVAGVSDIYTLAVQRQTGSTKQYANAAVRWTEQTQPF